MHMEDGKKRAEVKGLMETGQEKRRSERRKVDGMSSNDCRNKWGQQVRVRVSLQWHEQ